MQELCNDLFHLQEAASQLAEKEAYAIRAYFCSWTLTPYDLETYFGYWDDGNVWESFADMSSEGRPHKDDELIAVAVVVSSDNDFFFQIFFK